MKKVCIVVSYQYFAEVFLLDQLDKLSHVYEVTVITNTDKVDFLQKHGIKVNVISVRIERNINLFLDICALFSLLDIFRKSSFDSVHSFTPKTGLLVMIAARLTNIPIRIYTFTGQVWVTRSGAMRLLLKAMDKITSFLATGLLVDSFSQRDFLTNEKIVK